MSTSLTLKLSAERLASLDQWRASQPDHPTRLVAIAHLIDIGVAQAIPLKKMPHAKAKKAAKIASIVIDRIADRSEPSAVREKRKKLLVDGPQELQSHPKTAANPRAS